MRVAAVPREERGNGSIGRRLRDGAGIGKKRAAAIKEAWDAKRTERELYIFLQTDGVTPGQCVKLVKQFGAEA